MATEVIMPKLGMSMVEGTVVNWKKRVGDPVAKGEGILEISSEKIETEVESPDDGVLLAIAVEEGAVVPYGTVLGYVGQAGEQIGHPQLATAREEAATVLEAVPSTPASLENSPQTNPDRTQAGEAGKGNLKVSPVARKLAEEAGLDLATVAGTGPQGRITKEDVERALVARANQAEVKTAADVSANGQGAKSAAASADDTKRVPVTGMRKVIATRM